MDATMPTVASDPSSGFVFCWLGAWMLATALSSLLLAVFHVLDERYRARPAIYVGIAGLLSLPAVGGLLHGFVMRGLLRRSTL